MLKHQAHKGCDRHRGTENQGRCRKEEDRGRLKQRAGQGTRRDGNTPAVNNVLSLASSEKKSDAPEQGALRQREYGMRSEKSTLNCLKRLLPRDARGLYEDTREIGKALLKFCLSLLKRKTPCS